MRLAITRILLFCVAFLTLIVLGVFIFSVDPETLTHLGQWSFFGLSLLFFQSIFMLILLSLARRFLEEEGTKIYQGAAFRQSFFLAVLVVGVLGAQYFRVLTWWGTLFFVAFLLLLELTYRRLQSLKR